MVEVPGSWTSSLIRVAATLPARQAYAEQRELEDFREAFSGSFSRRVAEAWPRNFSRCNLLPPDDPNEK